TGCAAPPCRARRRRSAARRGWRTVDPRPCVPPVGRKVPARRAAASLPAVSSDPAGSSPTALPVASPPLPSGAPAPRAAVHFRSLGCPKNQLDTEVMLGTLAVSGYALAERLEDADVAVVNTCSFIESAREESIEAILEVAELRETGRLRALVVAGCLPQRYGADLAKELPEVDAFVGTGSFPRIAEILDRALQPGAPGRRQPGVYVDAGRTHLYDEHAPRVLVGPGHSAYVKIAEGCDRICAFCAIPAIRGRFQSRTLPSLLAEARQ